jgi:hypothetical protein
MGVRAGVVGRLATGPSCWVEWWKRPPLLLTPPEGVALLVLRPEGQLHTGIHKIEFPFVLEKGGEGRCGDS